MVYWVGRVGQGMASSSNIALDPYFSGCHAIGGAVAGSSVEVGSHPLRGEILVSVVLGGLGSPVR